MPRWHKEYLGLAECPRELSQFYLDLFFSFSRDELTALRSRYKPDLRVGAALQVGFLKMTGCTMSTCKVVPVRLLQQAGFPT